MSTPEERAYEFLHEETEFHLGMLTTEQPHPATAQFGQTIRADTAAGLRMPIGARPRYRLIESGAELVDPEATGKPAQPGR